MSAIDIIQNYLDSDDAALQAEALIDSVERKFYAAVPKILKLLKSSEATIRSDAAYALGYLGTEEIEIVGTALIEAIDDAEEIVRSEVVEALGALRYSPALDSIKSLLRNDSSALVRASAAEAIGELRMPEAIEALELTLLDSDEDESVRAYAANSIGLLGTPEILSKLDKHLRSEHSLRVKAELLGAKYWLGAKGALKKLLSLLENADESLATSILNILTDLKVRQVLWTDKASASNLYNILTKIGQRFPILSHHAEELISSCPFSIRDLIAIYNDSKKA